MYMLLKLKEMRDLAKKNAGEIYAKADSEDRELTPEESKRFDDLTAEYRQLDADIERREKLEAMKKTEEPEQRKTTPQVPASPERRIGRIESVRPSVKLRSFKTYDEAHTAGKWLQGALLGDVNARNWCQERGMEFRALVEGQNSLGGYLVPNVMENAVIDNRDRYGLLRQEVTPKQMTSDTLTVPVKSSGLTAYFVGENTEVTESTSGWSNVQLVAKKLAVLAKYSSEVSEDSIISLAEDIANDMGMAIAEKEDRCWLLGDGTAIYGGMYGLVTWFEAHDASGEKGVVVAASGHDTYAEYDSTDLGTLIGALPLKYRQGAKLYMSPTTWSAVFDRLMVAAGGNNMANLAAGAPLMYGGYPVAFSELLIASATPSTNQDNKSIILFGNANRTTLLGDRRGMTVKASADRHIELDEMVIVATTRFDIVNHNLGDTSKAGAMVSLQGE